MARSRLPLAIFYEEAKRRHVLRVGFAYVLVAFATLEGADLILPSLMVPDWAYRMLVVLALFLFPIVLVVAWVYDLTPEGVRRTPDLVRAQPEAGRARHGAPGALAAADPHAADADTAADAQAASHLQRHRPRLAIRSRRGGGVIDSLAILPFSNGSGDADGEYLCDGITESIINKMSTISGIRVVPRASAFRYKNRDYEPAEIVRELNVAALVTGRVHQRSGVLVAQAELIDLDSEAQLWGEHYNRPLSDIFQVQEEMAEEIARSLRLQLTKQQRERLRRRDTQDTEAYQEYLKGRYYWNKRTADGLRMAITHFQEACDLDPQYALAYSGLADTYNVLGYYNIDAPATSYPRAKAAAARALEIDAELAEAHASLGYALLFFDRRYEDAARSLEHAIEVNPSYATAHQWYGWYLLVRERFDETVQALERAVKLDPLSLIINDHYAYALFLAGRYADAVSQIDRTLQLDPRYPLGYWRLGSMLVHQGRLEEGIAAFEKAVAQSQGILARGYLGQALALAGRADEARTILHDLENSGGSYVSPLDRALIHAGLGEVEAVMLALDQAVEQRVSDVVRLKLLPWPPEVRTDARFDRLVKRLGLHAPRNAPDPAGSSKHVHLAQFGPQQ
jgi:TolB-like protein/Flp pilus assembly protein TadD